MYRHYEYKDSGYGNGAKIRIDLEGLKVTTTEITTTNHNRHYEYKDSGYGNGAKIRIDLEGLKVTTTEST